MRLTEHDADLAQYVADAVFGEVMHLLIDDPGWTTDDAFPAARVAYWSVKAFLRASLALEESVDTEVSRGYRAAQEALERLSAEKN